MTAPTGSTPLPPNLKKAAADYALQLKNEVQLRGVWRDLSLAMQRKNWDEAEARLADAEKLMPEDARENLDMQRVPVLLGRGDFPGFYKLAGRLSDAHPENAMLQNQLAWQIATHEGIKNRDLELAYKIAVRANDASGGQDSSIIDTVARVQFMRGKKAEAIALEEKAVKLSTGRQKSELQKVLDSYKKGQLPAAEP